LLGFFCGVYISINLTHLEGLLFYYTRSKIDGAVEGKLKYSYRFSTVSSAISNLTFGLLLGILLLFTEASAFAVAFVAGPFVEALKMFVWAERGKNKQRSAEDGKKSEKTIPWKRMVIGLVIILIAFWFLGTFVDDSYHDDYRKALEAYDRQDYETALEKFAELHKLRPDEPCAHFSLALCYYQLGQLEESKKMFELYTEKYPEDDRAREARAMAEHLYLELKGENE
jgi:tetratricopeptide (TPR) repeat protein